MREITQRLAVKCRILLPPAPLEHGGEGGEPMQLLRASAVALPFVGLALVVALLSVLVEVAK